MNHRLGEEGMNMVKEHYHPMNHRLEVEYMDMVGIYMVEVDGMDMVEERLLNHRLKVEGINTEDSDMEEDITVEVDVVEREHEGMVLARHWTSDEAEMQRRARREWDELTTSGYSKGHTTFTS
jgi:hypothetical protein